MHLLDLTLQTPAENLALDEALLDTAEANTAEAQAVEAGAADSHEVLRLWEPRSMMVVVGNSSSLEAEVNLDACRARGIPVLRRASGGAAIVTGPGCLMYALVLSYSQRPHLRAIDHAHHFVLDTIATALNRALSGTPPAASSQQPADLPTAYRLPPTIATAGISDLILVDKKLGDKKFSGNSLRCKRNHFLYHGTLLYSFPLEKIDQFLKMPIRQPAYRAQRSHVDFLTNLPLDVAALRQALIIAFSATEKCSACPSPLTASLVTEKYSSPDWNQRL